MIIVTTMISKSIGYLRKSIHFISNNKKSVEKQGHKHGNMHKAGHKLAVSVDVAGDNDVNPGGGFMGYLLIQNLWHRAPRFGPPRRRSRPLLSSPADEWRHRQLLQCNCGLAVPLCDSCFLLCMLPGF